MHHFAWWPGLLVTLDANGMRLGTFVNSGWIRGVVPAPDDRYLLVGGISNARESYFLAVLDARRPTGRSPEAPGTGTECLSCPDGEPLQYVVFPRSDVSRHQPFPAAGPTVVTFDSGSIEVHILSSESPNIADTIYTFAPTDDDGSGQSGPYTLRGVTFSDSYREWHRRLEQEGRLDHRAEDCPERRGLDLQRWIPGAGWQPVRVSVR